VFWCIAMMAETAAAAARCQLGAREAAATTSHRVESLAEVTTPEGQDLRHCAAMRAEPVLLTTQDTDPAQAVTRASSTRLNRFAGAGHERWIPRFSSFRTVPGFFGDGDDARVSSTRWARHLHRGRRFITRATSMATRGHSQQPRRAPRPVRGRDPLSLASELAQQLVTGDW
jgi:hypothetical protein